MDGDGKADNTSWIGKGDGFLFLDRDGNGTVSGVGELSFINDLDNAKSDLDGLRAFDSNNDGILNNQDDRFADFGVWRDRDSDGIVDRGEIKTLGRSDIQSINLTGTAVNGSYEFGSVAVLNEGSFTRTDGIVSQFYDAAMTSYSGQAEQPNEIQLSGRNWWKDDLIFDRFDHYARLDGMWSHHREARYIEMSYADDPWSSPQTSEFNVGSRDLGTSEFEFIRLDMRSKPFDDNTPYFELML